MTYDLKALKERISCADVLKEHAIQWNGKKISCPLPGHEDKDPSFGLCHDDRGFVCYGCGRKGDVIGLQSLLDGGDKGKAIRTLAKLAGMKPEQRPKKRRHGQVEDVYNYTDATGKLLYQVVRYEPKDFRQRRRDPKNADAWLWNLRGVSRVLYRLPDVYEAALMGDDVFLAEGEKDCDALASLGLCATCNPGGATKWKQGFTEPLIGANVIILPDRDGTGRQHAALVAGALKDKAESVRVVELPDRAGHNVKDPADWIAAGGTAEELKEIISAAPPWLPPAKESQEMAVVSEVEKELAKTYGPALISEDDRRLINHQHFAARYVQESGIVYDPAVSRFYMYDGETGLWRHQTNGVTIRELGLCFHRILIEEGSPSLIAKRNASSLRGLLDLARGIAEHRDVFGRRRDAIHVANGMLVLDGDGNVDLRPFGPDWYSRNRSEIAWGPEADCPRFKSELLLSAMDEADARLIQLYAGQCLLGVNLSQTFLVLRGTPGGGKSTLANILEGLIGRHNVTELRIRHLTERFELIRYVGRTLLSGKDVPGDFLNMRSAHVLKALVGGDTLEGEVKNGNESFSIDGRFNVLISTNTRLRVKLDSDAGAWRRRMLIVDYVRPKVTRPIPGFDELLLRGEGPGILRWAVEGAIALMQELNSSGCIQLTEVQRRRVDDLLSESDSVRSFVRECIEKQQGSAVTVHDLTTAYRDYCETREWEALRERMFQRELPDSMLEFHRVIRSNDIRNEEGKAVRGFRGVRLLASSVRPSEASEPYMELPYSDVSGDDSGPLAHAREEGER